MRALVNLSIASGSGVTGCPPPTIMVSGRNWNSDMNDGAGGDYVYLCATYAEDPPQSIVALQAAGLTSKYKPNCGSGWDPLAGSLTKGSRNPNSAFLCLRRGPATSTGIPISQLSGALASIGCPKETRAVTSVEEPAVPFEFDPVGVGLLLCVPAPPPPIPPAPPPGPRAMITDLHVVVVPSGSARGAACPRGSALVRATNATSAWDLDFNQGAGGDYTYLCASRVPSAPPIGDLLGFHTPSAAEPFGNCPSGFTKVRGNGTSIGADDLNHGSRNPGAMFLCYRKGVGAPIYELAGLAGAGGAAEAGCKQAGYSEAVHGPPAYPGIFDFDPAGVRLTLCADRHNGSSPH
jgi:hypothetical protein